MCAYGVFECKAHEVSVTQMPRASTHVSHSDAERSVRPAAASAASSVFRSSFICTRKLLLSVPHLDALQL